MQVPYLKFRLTVNGKYIRLKRKSIYLGATVLFADDKTGIRCRNFGECYLISVERKGKQRDCEFSRRFAIKRTKRKLTGLELPDLSVAGSNEVAAPFSPRA